MWGEQAVDDPLATAADDLARLVRRLRSLSPSAWRDRRAPVTVALAGLVRLGSELEGVSPAVPVVADHVLPDAIAVVGGDVLAVIVERNDAASLETLTQLLTDALRATQ